jgi:hypothetical protein
VRVRGLILPPRVPALSLCRASKNGARLQHERLTYEQLEALERFKQRGREREAREARERLARLDAEYARYDLERNNRSSHARIQRTPVGAPAL